MIYCSIESCFHGRCKPSAAEQRSRPTGQVGREHLGSDVPLAEEILNYDHEAEPSSSAINSVILSVIVSTFGLTLENVLLIVE